jgi:UDP-N-acetyl-D-galactosamine dehydrogenase
LLDLITIQTPHIAIFGLGNIGLPLAIALGEKYPTIGFDIDDSKIDCFDLKYLSCGLTLEI